ncbi:Zinc finger protein 32 [Armadillidium vulgare]|nr:Zinc finger protein 32 [Armadillidium vulgare]
MFCSSIPQNKSPPISGPQTSNPTVSKRCPFCEYESVIAHNVKRHIRFKHTNEKPFKCTVCVKSFATKSNLQVHMRIHTGERPYQCPLCSKAFTQLGSRSMHMRMVHSMEERMEEYYHNTMELSTSNNTGTACTSSSSSGNSAIGNLCPYCSYSSPHSHNVRRHILFKHTKNRPFPCTLCPKSFATNYYLQAHMKSHTGSRCSFCAKSFPSNLSLALHMKTVHPSVSCD